MVYKAGWCLLLFLYSLRLSALCTVGAIEVSPQFSTISPNGLIIIEGYGVYQELLDTYPFSSSIYLASSNHSVDLKVFDICLGQFELIQIILEPAELLKRGNYYTLKVDDVNKQQIFNNIRKYNRESSNYEAPRWLVTNEIDISPPRWKSLPKLIQKKTMWLGCGPVVFTRYRLNATDESQFLIETELENLKNNTVNQYFLSLDDYGTLIVGHGMCSGAFKYSVNQKYRVRFRLMDICGNSDGRWTRWIQFMSPFEQYPLPGIKSDSLL